MPPFSVVAAIFDDLIAKNQEMELLLNRTRL